MKVFFKNANISTGTSSYIEFIYVIFTFSQVPCLLSEEPINESTVVQLSSFSSLVFLLLRIL